MTKLSVYMRSFTNIFVTLLFTVCLIFLSSGTGMAIIAEGNFEGTVDVDTDALRVDTDGVQDWYESRGDDPSLLELDTLSIGGHTSKAKLIGSTTVEAYLTQNFSSPLTAISEIEWDIYIENIENTATDQAGFMLIGDDIPATTAGPNSHDSERFVCMAFYRNGGGSSGTMSLVAQDDNGDWTSVFPGLNLGNWNTIKVRCYLDQNEYNVYVNENFIQAIPARNDKTGLTHLSFAQLSNGAGTFYVDDISQVDLYTLAVETVGQGSVAPVPEGDTYDYDTTVTLYNYGAEVSLTPTADTGWEFTGWDGALIGDDHPATITMDSNKSVTATFAQTFDLTVTSIGNGTVTLDPEVGPYVDGTIVTLTPTADLGWEFTGWDGDLISEDSPATITMDGNKSVTATFALMTYGLNVIISGNGTVTLDPPTGPYEHGTTVTLTAEPEIGRHFTGWSGDLTGDNLEATLLMDGEKNVTANFAINTYTVTFIEGDNGNITDNLIQTVEHGGSAAAVTAVPENEYNFLRWSGDYEGNDNPLTLNNVTSNMNITANFAKNIYSVFFIAADNGSITGETGQTIESGVNCTEVTAVPDTGYHFVGWTGDYEGTNNPLTITNVLANMSITANFVINTYTVTFSPGDHGGLSGDINQTVDHGGSCAEITAYPEEGYQFNNWSGDYTGDENPLTISNVTSDMNITANYVLAYDGNNDGIPDIEQDHVKNLTTEDQQSVTLEFAESAEVTSYGLVDDPSPDAMPAGYVFEYGFFNFTIEGLEPGEATTVTIYLPDGTAAPDTYYKYGPTPTNETYHWYEFSFDGTTGAEINGNIITLHFVDGDRGDDDLSANGRIVDDGGPGFSTNDVVQEAGSDESQGATGGCFIETTSSASLLSSYNEMIIVFCISMLSGLIGFGRKLYSKHRL